MGNIVKLIFLCGHSPIRLMESLSLMYTANGKRQTADSSWEFLKIWIENKQIKTAQNNSYG